MPHIDKRTRLRAAAAVAGAALLFPLAANQIASAATSGSSGGVAAAATNTYTQHFLDMYNKIHDSANGYFSPKGIPYHAVETLMVEGPDYGHETVSETYSFYIFLEAEYGQATGNWAPFNAAWASMEQYIIPTHDSQTPWAGYNVNSPAQYMPEHPYPSGYPSQGDTSVRTGPDPLYQELVSTYGTTDMYAMHWMIDTDNVYGYGNSPGKCEAGPSEPGPSFINNYQRGEQESTWETVTQPTCDNFKYGKPNSGYLDLFVAGTAAQQWKFSAAPDADARAIQAAYWAYAWAKDQGKLSDISATLAKAGKLGDYIRYGMYDKYFKKIGNCTSPSCTPGTGKDSSTYLINWYFAWGGALGSGGWSWRIGSSAAHFGYQNPVAAYALSNVASMKPQSPTGADDWAKSLTRQIEFYTWLQSAEGAIAGGATNSWGGSYGTPPSDVGTFYGMAYDWQPVYHDPPSNQWFGMQTWSMERVAEYYYMTKDTKVKSLLDKWVAWVVANTTATGSSWKIPGDLTWTGSPVTWNPSSPQPNTNLHVTIANYSQDVGLAGSLARALTYYAAATGDTAAKTTAKGLLDSMWTYDVDSKGISAPETRKDYNRFTQKNTSPSGDGLYIPSGWQGTMPNGDVIKSGDSFLDIRTWYKNDPDWSKVQAYLDGGSAPTFRYHRFWGESDITMAYNDYGRLLGGTGGDTTAPSVPTGLTSSSITSSSVKISWTASTDDTAVTGYDIYRGGTKVGSSTTTSYTDSGLTASTTYSYTVKAKDAAGNVSAASSALSVKTSSGGSDTTPPSTPTNFHTLSVGSTAVRLTWNASTDNVGVTGYDIYKWATRMDGTKTSLTITLSGLTPDRTYTFSVRAHDAAGNQSAAATITVKTSSVLDTQAPTAPTGLKLLSSTATSVRLGWTAATDNVAVTAYDILANGSRVSGTAGSTTATVTGLKANTTYSFTVKAKDANNNISSASSALSVKTPSS